MNKNDQDGWTLIEVLTVIAIILVLTATVGFSTVKYVDKARIVAAKTQIESFTLALETYYIDCGAYPTQQQGLQVLWEKPIDTSITSSWDGPYLHKALPNDPWGNPYIYSIPGQNDKPFTVFSYGADGYEGGEGKNADIYSWE